MPPPPLEGEDFSVGIFSSVDPSTMSRDDLASAVIDMHRQLDEKNKVVEDLRFEKGCLLRVLKERGV